MNTCIRNLKVAALAGVGTTALLMATPVAHATIAVTDVIPFSLSDEGDNAPADFGQHSEPSLTINPLDPSEMVAGSFSSIGAPDGSVVSPYEFTTDGGKTWLAFGSQGTQDKSLAWTSDGSAIFTSYLDGGDNIVTKTGTLGTGLNTVTNVIANGGVPACGGSSCNDQPWVVAGQGKGSANTIFLGFNDFANSPTTNTAVIATSHDGGVTFTKTFIDPTPQVVQDGPPIRIAAANDGKTVYGMYVNWNNPNFTVVDPTNGAFVFPGQVMVTKSTDDGNTWTALNAGANSEVAATNTPFETVGLNYPISVGRERNGSDNAIAVDPKNPNHIVVAYSNAGLDANSNPTGVVQLFVSESKDGGQTWSQVFSTPANVRAGQPAIAIAGDGAIGLLYNDFTGPLPDQGQPAGRLETQLVITRDDFATTDTQLLASGINRNGSITPGGPPGFDPYLGDFINLYAVGDAFRGIFSMNSDANCLNAFFPGGVSYNRAVTGFKNGSVCASTFAYAGGDPTEAGFDPRGMIDPFYFSVGVPEPVTLSLFGAGLAGLAAARRRKK